MSSTYYGDKPATPMEAFGHHGVKGMKWGVRKDDKKGGSSGPSKQEAKQQKREVKALGFEARAAKGEIRVAELKKELAAVPPGFKSSFKRNDLMNQKNNQIAYNRALRKEADRARQGKMTNNQKAMIVGGVMAVGVLGAFGASYLNETGQLNSLKLRGASALRGKPFEFAKNPALAKKMTPDQVLRKVASGVNPNYNTPGGQMNCRRCSFAYELRRRGFDVNATTTAMGAGHSESGLINALTPGKRNVSRLTSLSTNVASNRGIRAMIAGDSRTNPATTFSVKANRGDHSSINGQHTKFGQAVLDNLKKMPEGSRGEIVWDMTQFGHSMSWEIFNGKPVMFDTQKAQKYDLSDPQGFQDLQNKWGIPRAAEATRLDNLDLDHKFLSRWATNSKEK